MILIVRSIPSIWNRFVFWDFIIYDYKYPISRSTPVIVRFLCNESISYKILHSGIFQPKELIFRPKSAAQSTEQQSILQRKNLLSVFLGLFTIAVLRIWNVPSLSTPLRSAPSRSLTLHSVPSRSTLLWDKFRPMTNSKVPSNMYDNNFQTEVFSAISPICMTKALHTKTVNAIGKSLRRRI